MSAPKALKAMSLRDSLGKTVRLLTKQGVSVQFRGHKPFVQARGDKVVRLVLPEVNDNAPPELIEALQGFLDHEVGHIFYTPFGKATKYGKGDPRRLGLANILEDIRLEKLLPRDLPGTKENLERMYDNVMDTYFGPSAMRANEPDCSESEAFSSVMICAMRALAGQKAFKLFMDRHDLWRHFEPLVVAMPDLSKRLRSMEKYEDVMRLADDILAALQPMMPDDPAEPADPGKGEQQDQDNQDDDSEDGTGSGDGEGQDSDEDGDDSCAGDGDEDGDGDEAGDEDGDNPSDDDESDNLRKEKESDKPGKDGGKNRSLRDALRLLEPTQRRALFLYKKRKQTVAQIAGDLNITEDETVDVLAKARKRLREVMNGG